MKDKNTYGTKAKRFIKAFYKPVSEKRRGECLQCGKCCKLPNICPFLREEENGNCKCLIYPLRPRVCKKYPLDGDQSIVDGCGYEFPK